MKYGEGTDFSVGTAGYAEYPAVYRNGIGNPVAARRTVERILKAIRQLEQFPLSGTPLQYNGVDTGYRYVTSGNYVTFYIGTHTTAQVVRVLYGRRDTIRILLGCSFQPEETEEDIE